MTKLVIPLVNQLSYTSIPRNKDLGLQIKNTCNFPYRTLVVDWHGNCFICACEAWLPITVGNIMDFDNLIDIWNTPTSKVLQQDVDQKLFTNCAVDRCGITNTDNVYDYYYVSINIDESCNLRCPSCRTEARMLQDGPEFDKKLAMVNHLVKLLENFDYPCHIVMSGNGDPLASHIMRPLVQNYTPLSNHTFRLFTNGLLLKKQLPASRLTEHITQFFISIDAGSAEVYERVRLGGNFNLLLENFNYLRTLSNSLGAEVLLKFVLQKDNWHDMYNFVNLCHQYEFNGVINRLEDWGTWSNFSEQDVIGNENHPDHVDAITMLADVYAQHHKTIQFNSSLAKIADEQFR